MRYKSILIQGFGPFADAEIDLESIPGRVIAVTGPNGAGKSTFLELLAGSLYRKTPTRGSLTDLATSRSSRVRTVVDNGTSSFTITHNIDAVNRQCDVLLIDGDNQPVLKQCNVKEYDEWASTNFSSKEVFYASVFSAQGSGGFLDAKPADRKKILTRVLGVEHLQTLSEYARQRASQLSATLQNIEGQLQNEQRRAVDVAEAERQLEIAKIAATAADNTVESSRLRLTDAEASARDVLSAKEALATYMSRQSELDLERRDLRAKIADIDKRIANNQSVLATESDIRDAVARLDTVRAEVTELERRLSTAQRDCDEFSRTASDADQKACAARRRESSARSRQDSARKRLANADAISEAASQLDAKRAVLASSQARLDQALADLDAAQNKGMVGLGDRVDRLRCGMHAIVKSDSHESAVDTASECLYDDDTAVRDAQELPKKMSDARIAQSRASDEVRLAQHDLTRCQELASQARDIGFARDELALAEKDVLSASIELADAEKVATEARRSAESAKNLCRKLGVDLAKKRDDVEATGRTALLIDTVNNARTRIEELTPQLDAAKARIDSIVADISAMGPCPIVPPEPQIDAIVMMVRRSEQTAKESHELVAVKKLQLDQSIASAMEICSITAKKTATETEYSDWIKLSEDLGQKGLQAYEIDAVGPELTELVNDLLRTCVGSRWSVSIETSKPSADGKKDLETCDVKVLDAERGRDAKAETLSGGERVIVGEAIALALSMLACRRSGVVGATLVRDETGAALDPENAKSYVSMLRRAAEIVGANQVLFVSHNPDVQELADARIVVADGKLRVAA